jgi:hypothetical protein
LGSVPAKTDIETGWGGGGTGDWNTDPLVFVAL